MGGDHDNMDDPDVRALLPAVAQQLASPETPFVPETLRHLVEHHGIAPDEARYMIAFCLADEIERLGADGGAFDLGRYRMLLALLPTLPEAR